MARRAPGDNVLPDQFQTVAAVLASDWCQKTVFFWHQSEARTAATVWNWSGKTLSPGALLAILYFSSCHIFFRPFRLFLVPTICPWVSEDGIVVAAAGKQGRLGNFPHVLMEMQGKSTRLQTSPFVPYSRTTLYVVSQFIAGPKTPIMIFKTATSIICYYLIIVLILIII